MEPEYDLSKMKKRLNSFAKQLKKKSLFRGLETRFFPKTGFQKYRKTNKKKLTMMPFDKCPVCGGEMVEKELTEIVRGGGHTATVKLKATVCQRGGERYFPLETVRLFENIKTKLERQETEEFKPTGRYA